MRVKTQKAPSNRSLIRPPSDEAPSFAPSRLSLKGGSHSSSHPTTLPTTDALAHPWRFPCTIHGEGKSYQQIGADRVDVSLPAGMPMGASDVLPALTLSVAGRCPDSRPCMGGQRWSPRPYVIEPSGGRPILALMGSSSSLPMEASRGRLMRRGTFGPSREASARRE
jgi:hypothetical protein